MSGQGERNDDVNPLLEELRRNERKQEVDAAPKAKPVYVHRAPSAGQRAGVAAAVMAVVAALMGRGAGRAAPTVIRILVIGALLAALGYGGLLLLDRLDNSEARRTQLMADLDPFRRPIQNTANQMLHKAGVRGGINFVDFQVPPVVSEMPTRLNYIAYRDEDRLNVNLGTASLAEGTVYLKERVFTINVKNEGRSVGNERITLGEDEEQ